MRIIKKTVVLSISLITCLLVGPVDAVRSLWYDLVLRKPKPAGVSLVHEVYARVLTTVEEALKSLLPDAQEIKEETIVLTDEQKQSVSEKAGVKFDPAFDKEFQTFIGMSNGVVAGYAIKNAVKGKHGLIHYMVAMDPDGKITKVMVLEYSEKRGKPIAKNRFLKQFKGKTIGDRIKLKKDIRGVTGASISSRGMTKGIRKLVHVINEIYVKQ